MSLSKLLFLLLAVHLGTSCRDNLTRQSGSAKESPLSADIDKISSDTGILFPVDSTVLQFVKENALIDASWVAKVSLPAIHYDNFETMLLSKPRDMTTIRGAFSESIGWWIPNNIILTHQYLEGSQTIITIIVSRDIGVSNSNCFIVYIQYSIF